jgi:hypothetical protein
MKNIKELTDDQVIKIGSLALQNLMLEDWFISLANGVNKDAPKVFVERELYDEKENLMVIRLKIDGMPDCWMSIWEEDMNVDVYEGGDDSHTANQVKIFKLLQEWGFI